MFTTLTKTYAAVRTWVKNAGWDYPVMGVLVLAPMAAVLVVGVM